MECNASEGRRLDDAGRKLAADHFRLAMAYARWWVERMPSLREEFHSAAAWACVDAARKFDPARGDFRSLLKVAVRRRCGKAFRAVHGRPAAVVPWSVVFPGLAFARPGGATYHHVDNGFTEPPAPDDAAGRDERLDGFAIDDLLDLVDRDGDRECVRLLYAEGLDGPTAAAKLGISKQRVHQKSARGLDDIRRKAGRYFAA